MKRLGKLIAVLFILSLLLVGCGDNKADIESSAEMTGVEASSLKTGDSKAGKSEIKSESGKVSEDVFEPISRSKGSDGSEGEGADVYNGGLVSDDADMPATDLGGMAADAPLEKRESAAIEEPMSTEDEMTIVEDWMKDKQHVKPYAGLLTAGEWNDNRNPDFIRNILSDEQDTGIYRILFEEWGMTPFNMIPVLITASGSAIRGAEVVLMDSDGNRITGTVTDNGGMAYLYYNLTVKDQIPASVRVSDDVTTMTYELKGEELNSNKTVVIEFEGGKSVQKQALDLMFVFDTTGSMDDELNYLQAEMRDVIERVKNDNGNIPVNLSMNFYRDKGDEYVVKGYPFSQDIDEQIEYLNMEYANGGGDYPEAVEMALKNAVYEHEWSKDNVKLMFLILDAPPHNTGAVRDSLKDTLSEAAARGIRIIPVAASGVDKETEFLLRTMAMTTGGTYTFLTNDSGIGYSHIEPTIGEHKVEQLNDLIVRIITEYLQIGTFGEQFIK